jgi:hypothetical protein
VPKAANYYFLALLPVTIAAAKPTYINIVFASTITSSPYPEEFDTLWRAARGPYYAEKKVVLTGKKSARNTGGA